MRNPEEAGEKIVVQGGTFLNDAVLRAIEHIVGREVIRPNIAGIMGAYGAALLAKESYSGHGESTLLKPEALQKFQVKTSHTRCNRCENNCLLTVNSFGDGERFITGNRCERGEGKETHSLDIPNMYDYKYRRLFSYTPREMEDSVGVIYL